MHLDKALGIINRVCTDDLTKTALAKVRKSLVETTKRNKELKGINDFLEEYVSGTIPD
jgi:hypothetical protein